MFAGMEGFSGFNELIKVESSRYRRDSGVIHLLLSISIPSQKKSLDRDLWLTTSHSTKPKIEEPTAKLQHQEAHKLPKVKKLLRSKRVALRSRIRYAAGSYNHSVSLG